MTTGSAIWSNFRPQPPFDGEVRDWLRRQRLNARIAREVARYLGRLRGRDLDEYRFRGPDANAHVPRLFSPPPAPLRILAIWRHNDWENHNLLPALRNFGEVHHFDPSDDFDPPFLGEPDWGARTRMQTRLREVASSAPGWDLLLFYSSGAYFDPAFLRQLRSLEVPMMNMGLDDIVFFEDRKVGGVFRGAADIAGCFDVYCTSSVIGFHKALAVGALPYYLPGGANPEFFRPLPGVERDLDVVLVGSRFYDRGEIVEYLARHGVAVHAVGTGWPSGPVTADAQVELLNRARIVLGFNRASGSDWMSIKGRDHEVPMTGAFHLVNRFAELRNVYEPGVEVGVYRDRRDLVKKIRHYLSHGSEREAIAAAGMRRARGEHSWQRRFEELFARTGLIAPRRTGLAVGADRAGSSRSAS